MIFNKDILLNYLLEVPLPLAIERWFECEIYKTKEFKRPILDIGCGEGIFAHILFGEKVDVGIDPNIKELQRAKSYSAYNELIECFGNKIPKPDNYFKTIFTNSVLEHIPDIDSVLREANRLLASDGRMYVTIPTDYFDRYSLIYQLLSFLGLTNFSEKYRQNFNKFWKHFHFYNKAKWGTVFIRNGFKVVSHREYADKNICLFNDFLAPLCFFSFITKKIFNRWFLIKPLRLVFAKIEAVIFSRYLRKHFMNDTNCGLIFFELAKR